MKNLLNVIAGLRHWQKQQQSEGHSVTHRCLEAVRACCHAEGLELPPSVGHADTALDCFENLEADPRKWGWFQIHHDAIGTLETPCLVFYGDCGTLPDGRKAGHIGLLGIIGALLNVIPYIGGLVAVALPMIVALATVPRTAPRMFRRARSPIRRTSNRSRSQPDVRAGFMVQLTARRRKTRHAPSRKTAM